MENRLTSNLNSAIKNYTRNKLNRKNGNSRKIVSTIDKLIFLIHEARQPPLNLPPRPPNKPPNLPPKPPNKPPNLPPRPPNLPPRPPQNVRLNGLYNMNLRSINNVNQLNKLMSLAEAQGYNNKIQNFVKRIKNRKNTIVRNRNKANSVANGKPPPPLPTNLRRNNTNNKILNANANIANYLRNPTNSARRKLYLKYHPNRPGGSTILAQKLQQRFNRAIKSNTGNSLRQFELPAPNYSNRQLALRPGNNQRQLALRPGDNQRQLAIRNVNRRNTTRNGFNALPGSNAFNVNKNTQKRYMNAAHRSFPFWNKRRYWVGNPLNRK